MMNAVTPLLAPQKIGLRAVDYLMLSDAGAFDGYGRTELIEGEIWAVNAIHSWQARVVLELGRQIGNALEATPSELTAYSAGSVFLTAIEISDSTATTDLGVKLRLYGGAGIPEYWVVERDTRVIHQMWAPSDGVYVERRTVAFGERVTAATLAWVEIETTGL